MTQATLLHSILQCSENTLCLANLFLPHACVRVCAHTRAHTHTQIPLCTISTKKNKQTPKHQNPAAKYYDIPISKHKTERFTKMNKIYHLQSASTL